MEPLNISTASYPWCTHQCLLSAKISGLADKNCPNFKYHDLNPSGHHLVSQDSICHQANEIFSSPNFESSPNLEHLRKFEAHPDFTPTSDKHLEICESTKKFFYKIITPQGRYTLVVKSGNFHDYEDFFDNEKAIYEHVEVLQGKVVPVYLGGFDVGTTREDKMCYMLMSYAGTSLRDQQNWPQSMRTLMGNKPDYHPIRDAVEQFHSYGVCHGWLVARSCLLDAASGKIFLVHFSNSFGLGEEEDFESEELSCFLVKDVGKQCRREIEWVKILESGENVEALAEDWRATGVGSHETMGEIPDDEGDTEDEPDEIEDEDDIEDTGDTEDEGNTEDEADTEESYGRFCRFQ